MSAYFVCRACGSYVKDRETGCPFCGAPRHGADRVVSRAIGTRSRAQWLAAVVVASVGCTTSSGTPSQPDANAAAPKFACGAGDASISCLSYREYCATEGWDPSSVTCVTYDAGTDACAAVPRCGGTENTICEADDAGGVTVTCYQACYGAPPARVVAA